MYRDIFFSPGGQDEQELEEPRPASSIPMATATRGTVVRLAQNLAELSELLLVHLNILAMGLLFSTKGIL